MKLPIPDIQENIKATADMLFAAAKKLMEAHEILGDGKPETQSAGSNGNEKPPQKVAQPKKTLSRADPFYNVLKVHGANMKRVAILAAAKKNGSQITKLDTASVYMNSDSRFRRAGRGLWGLVEWDKTA